MMNLKRWSMAAALYLALTVSLSLLAGWLERRLPVHGAGRG